MRKFWRQEKNVLQKKKLQTVGFENYVTDLGRSVFGFNLSVNHMNNNHTNSNNNFSYSNNNNTSDNTNSNNTNKKKKSRIQTSGW